MMRINRYNIFAVVLLATLSSCSTFIAPRWIGSGKESASVAVASESVVDSQLESAPDSVATTEKVRVMSSKQSVAAQETRSDEVEGASELIEMADNVEPIEIPRFTTEQSAHVVIAEFKDEAMFEDLFLSREELAQTFFYPRDGHITSDYGWRGSRMHSGVDIKAYLRDNIYAAFDGVVRVAMYNGAFGNCVVIRHYNGLETLYAHATKMLVKVNDKVKAGDVIALAGSTGRATGVHLHFEVRAAGQTIDPNLILDTEGRKFNDKNLYVSMRGGRIFGSNSDDAATREEEIRQITAVKYHVVKSGDTLSRIAVNNHTTVTNLCKLNNISSRSILKIGQRLRVK